MLGTSHYIVSSSSSSISLSWASELVPNECKKYIIKYCQTANTDYLSKTTTNYFEEIDELQNDTEYKVQVYWENEDGDNIVLFKEICKTKKSGMDYLKNQNTSIDKSRRGQPVLYEFQPVHKREENGLQICDMIAEYDPGLYTSTEKTVLLLGATGTGKSTLIDGLINYIAGVSYNEDYRFSVIHKTAEERIQKEKPGESQTSTTTIYRIPELEGSRLSCKVNIIDTIGFDDTRQHFETKLTNQLQALFSGVIEHLDAVLIVIPLSVTRLTEGQKEVFSSISNIFGREIEENMCVAITHDDSGEATCLSLLEKAITKFPECKVFRFTNSYVLRTPPTKDENGDFKPEKIKATRKEQKKNWKNRSDAFSQLFNKINELPKTTVKSSHDVMVARHRLQIQLQALDTSILEQTQRIVNYKLAKELEHSTNRTDQTFSKKQFAYKHKHTGRTSINCRICKMTCHGGCWVPLDVLKWTCESMIDNKCIVCEKKCNKNDHDREKWEYILTLEEHLYTVAEFVNVYEESFLDFLKTVNKVDMLIKELASKALRPDVLSTHRYIEQIIQDNNKEKQEDYASRGVVLTKVKDHIEKGLSIWNLKLADLVK